MSDEPQVRRIAFADFPEDQRFTFRLAPLPGRLLNAETIGGALTNISKIIKTSNREYEKGNRLVAVCGIRLCEDGAFEADLVEMPVRKAGKKSPENATET